MGRQEVFWCSPRSAQSEDNKGRSAHPECAAMGAHTCYPEPALLQKERAQLAALG